MAGLSLSGVGEVYDDGTRAVRNLNVDVADGEFLVFVGPSGCGKTTALRMVAGLETVTEGELRIGDRLVNSVPPRDRDVAMVPLIVFFAFQRYFVQGVMVGSVT
ncbi:MAG: ATP-binding cassette domain-containing protein [Mycobacteriaceae bacterium]